MQRKHIRSGIFVSILVFIDFVIKILIDNFFMEEKVYISNWLGFVPFLNKQQLSFFNHEMGLNMNLIFLIILNIGAIIILIVCRRRLEREKEWTKSFDNARKILLAGSICSLIDKLFWGGSLDYLLLYSKIVDLKDIYLFGAVCICFVEAVRQIIRKKVGTPLK